MPRAAGRWAEVAVLVTALLSLLPMLAACGGESGVQADEVPAATTASAGAAAPSPSVSVPAQAAAALTAYRRFRQSSVQAFQHPWGQGGSFPPAADYTRWSFDPVRLQTNTYVWNLYSAGAALSGTPPVSHVTVTKVDLGAEPYPSVTLTDCQIPSGSWAPHYQDDGSAVPTVTPSGAQAPPPWLQTVTMIFYRKHWGVYRTSGDTTRTCTAG